MGLGGFCSLKALSTRNDDPAAASRPFDKNRDGFVMSEGAGILVLEEYEHAKERGANILCELAGASATCDAYHITQPQETGDGPCRAMLGAIKDAKINPEDVDYINAHGTSTPVGDTREIQALRTVFGNDKVPAVSSTSLSRQHHGTLYLLVCLL